MGLAEIVGAVLQIAHVAKEVLAQLLDRLHRGGGGKRRTSGRVSNALLTRQGTLRRRRMSRQEARDENAEDEGGYGEDGDEERVEADECVDGEEGHGVRGVSPGQQTDDSCLELEDNTDAGVEATKVVGHGSNVEIWPLVKGRSPVVGDRVRIEAGIIFGGDDLLEQPGRRC